MSLEGALIRAPCCSVATVLLKCHVKKIVVTCDNLSRLEKSLWAGPTHKLKIREELVGGSHQIKKKIKSPPAYLRYSVLQGCLPGVYKRADYAASTNR